MKSTSVLAILAALAAATSTIQADQKTRLVEPYAPKPSGPAPTGWEIKLLEGSSVESKTKLKNGRQIKVNAPAYELVPVDGVVMREPGYQPKLTNAQKETIGAALTEYSELAEGLQKTLEKTLKEMGDALGKQKGTPKTKGVEIEVTPEPAKKTKNP
jgi:hypothetical protein